METIIQGLWVGTRLSILEHLSIRSFLHHGHAYHLYVYNEVQNVPPGTLLKDGNDILSAGRIFQYTTHPSYAGFSNFFRYKLLLERGGWWVDTDVVCLRPFDFATDYVFAAEYDAGQAKITSGIIKVPADSAIMAYAWHVCQTKDPLALRWGEVGPRLMAEAVHRFALENAVLSYPTFCPLRFDAWQRVLDPHWHGELPSTTYAIHLWNEMWRRNAQDKDAAYHPDCLYERLKRRYSVGTGDPPPHSAPRLA